MANDKRFVAKNGLDNNNLTITNVASPVNPTDVSTMQFSSNATNLTAGTVAAARLSGTYTITVNGNASTATTLQTARTISLTGDVTGSVSFDGSTNASITTTIAANSVALGTDTTGNYAASVAVSGNGLTITGAAGEGTAFTVNSNAVSTNTASTLVFRDASGNFSAGTITANLAGNATSANSATTATTATNANNVAITADATNSARFITFVSATSGNLPTLVDSGFTYNPSTDTLTIPNVSAGGISTTGNLTVGGNLTVNGTTTTVNSTVTTIDDPIITLGGDTAPVTDDNKDRGIEFRWHDGTAARTGFFGFDDSTGFFTFIPNGTNTSEVYSGSLGVLDALRITGSAASWTTARNLTLTGDASAIFTAVDGTANVSSALTLATVNANVGTFGSAAAVPVITVNAKGLVTAVTTAAITTGVNIVADNTNAVRYLTFTSATSGNVTSLNVDPTTTALTYNPSTQTITANINGNVTATSVSTSTLSYSGEVTSTSTSALQTPVGTTAQRPTGANGKIRYNTTLGRYEGFNSVGNAWATLGGGAVGGNTDQVFYENDKTITTNYTITTNKNAMSAGPITINDGVVVTVPDGSTWTVV